VSRIREGGGADTSNDAGNFDSLVDELVIKGIYALH
jgi:hypothetical protein